MTVPALGPSALYPRFALTLCCVGSHHWAVISGSIDPEDPSPQAAAWREIREETTLTPASLELMRQGKSYVLPDESIGREWTIYPFAFRLKDHSEGGKGEEGITLDWEHEDWAWYDPMEVEDSERFGAVPRLAESLRRVWVEKDLGAEAGAALTSGLDRLRKDHQSGARQLATSALQILRDIILAMDPSQPAAASWAKIRFAAWHIWKNGRESMGAAILSVLLAALKSMEEMLARNHTSTSAGWRDALVEELDRRIAARQDAASATSVAFANFLRDQFASRVESGRPLKVMTLSESSTIAHALRHVIASTTWSLDLRILESRPLFEGVSLASSLARDVSAAPGTAAPAGVEQPREAAPPPKVQVTLYTDASSALAAADVDIVLLGSDRIAESGAVSNKTGSLPAVLSAKHVSPEAKTVILSESEKVAPPGAVGTHVVEYNDPDQLARAWQAEFNSERVRDAAGTVAHGLGTAAAAGTASNTASCVDVRNIFFEWVPPELIDIYITERGVWTVEDVRKLSEALGVDEGRLFRDI